ncbi:MAG: Ig-like domain-containing protein [Proteobacteria bacterium]|nr:Ig-like domain-containing protein [Pseudomonadota bacterium]
MNNKFNRYSGFLTWFMALLLSALAVGCNGGGGGDSFLGGGGATGTAPTVTTVAPTPNAIGVPINTKIVTASFTNGMDPATLTPSSFTLACPAGTSQTGAVSYLASGGVATVTLTLTNPLPANTTCTATLTTAAKDTSGISLASNFSWTFTTGAAADTTAPTVTGTINANGATNVAINTKVGATFSEAMDPLTINANTFTLKQGTTAVSGTVSYVGVNAVFTPASNLAPSTTYTATVTTGAKDVAGNALAADFVISWTTGAAPDTTPPVVTGTVNANGSTNVAVNTKVAATFSEAMDPLSITTVNMTMKETASGNAVIGTVNYAGVTATFVPLNSLAASTGYTITVKGGTSGVKDLAGNAMVNDFVWSWTTGAALDTTPPLVTGTINANGDINVAVNTKVGATFSEGMDPLTITNTNFFLRETFSGALIAGVISYTGVHAVFVPINNLANSTGYTATVKGGINGVKDLAGNPMVNDFVWSWSTGAAFDTTPPTVVATVPLANATNMPYNAKQTVTFSEGMDPLSLTTLTYIINNGATTIPGVVTYSGLTAVFEPAINFADNANYTSTITTGAKDLAGNAMANNYVWNWSTGAGRDVTPPTVISTLQADGTNNVPITAKIGATFSEPMNPLTVTTATFSVKPTGSTTAVPGTLSYTGVSLLFTPLNSLAENTNYTATISQRAQDLAGNLMASDYVWRWTTFGNVIPTAATTTTTTAGATTTTTTATTTTTTHFLRRAAGFAVLAGDITNNAATTVTNGGDVGAATITANPTVNGGSIYHTGAPTYDNAMADLPAVIAAANSTILYPCGTSTAGGMGTVSMTPGVHCIASDAAISGVVILTLNGPGVYIFRTAGALATSAGSSVGFSGGANNTNTTVYWVVGSANVGSPGTFVGTILSAGAITLGDGDTLLNGRVLTTAAATLTNNTITKPTP